jgi:protein pelota
MLIGLHKVKALSDFHAMLSNDADRACYGLKEVLTANEQVAIDQLLITDTMYRSNNFVERKKYVDLIDSVRENGGKVYKFSSLHVSGEQLNNYTGIAAILRFPIPDIDEFEG